CGPKPVASSRSMRDNTRRRRTAADSLPGGTCMPVETKRSARGPIRPARDEARRWYELLHMGRTLDEKAPNYLKQGLGWSYHAPNAGHDGIQLALGLTFRPGRDYLFPYYRDLTTCLAAGLTVDEILLNGLSKADDVASGGRHMSNHFAKASIGIQNTSSAVANHAQHAA